ncbi:MAG: hypothetical protein IKZ09_03995 [Clostridia bacterium]|nr:hypothetical protein [Clostridia bacterium]
MKKIILSGLALLLAASAASCAENSESSVSESITAIQTDVITEATTEPQTPLEMLGERDLGGMVYTVFDCNYLQDLYVNIPGEEQTGDIVNDILLERDALLEERYNCSIAYFQSDSMSHLSKMVAAGDNDWQMMIAEMVQLGTQATSGMLANMCEVPYLEMNSAWWNPLLYENMRLHDAMYFSSSAIAQSVYQTPTCLYLNLKLYDDYDFSEDIYQTVIDGKWTVDVLNQMTSGMNQDLNADNKWSVYDDFFGLAVHPTVEPIHTMLISTGVSLSKINETGDRITADLTGDAHLIEVIEKLGDMFTTIKYNKINDFSTILFKEDRALFLMHKLESASMHLRDMESDYLILPCPKWDENQEQYRTYMSQYGCCTIAVPLTAQENEDAGFMTEAMARSSYELVRPIAYDMVYKDKTSRDPRTVEVLDILLDSLYIDFTYLYDFGGITSNMQNPVFKGDPLVSMLEKRQSACNDAVETFIEAWKPLED